MPKHRVGEGEVWAFSLTSLSGGSYFILVYLLSKTSALSHLSSDASGRKGGRERMLGREERSGGPLCPSPGRPPRQLPSMYVHTLRVASVPSQGTVVVDVSQFSTHQALGCCKFTSQITYRQGYSRLHELSAHGWPRQWRLQSPTWLSPCLKRGKDAGTSLGTNECDAMYAHAQRH